jgi:5-methylcytosine-specific restriction endonuclease McrA
MSYPQGATMDDTISIDFSCVNCDKVFVVFGPSRLYCSPRCHQDAKLVRYVRACIKSGRTNDPLVREAIRTRFAFAYSEKGYYDEKARRISAIRIQQVIERDGGLCRLCGAIGTEVDHINGNRDDLDNLQLLCHDCHSEKTEANMVPVTPDHERYEEILARENELRSRIDAPLPLRPCDDESNWKDVYKELMAEQRQLLRRIKEDVEGTARGRDPIEEERIIDELNELDELESQLQALEAKREERETQILTPEIQEQLNAINEEFSNKTKPLSKSIMDLRKRIKDRVEQYGLKVKGNGLQAVFRKGSIRWDTKALDEYAKTHPEILQFRLVGKASATIIPVNKAED